MSSNMYNEYTLMVHTEWKEDILLNIEIFYDIQPGDYVIMYTNDQVSNNSVYQSMYASVVKQTYLICQIREENLVNKKSNTGGIKAGRFEISVLKSCAEIMNFKPFQSIKLEKVQNISQYSIGFIELSFKKQYLQRGNMWRFKKQLLNRSVHIGQNLEFSKMSAQVQDIRIDKTMVTSGIITEQTKFVFRSRSARIIWLIQISAEMWDYDQNGILYFEKFLNQFVIPMLDEWKQLGASHMLTVLFFSRTFYLSGIQRASKGKEINPYIQQFQNKKSLNQNSDGIFYQDFFKVVIENLQEIDKIATIKKLRHEFWAFPILLGWKIPNLQLSKLDDIMNNSTHSAIGSSDIHMDAESPTLPTFDYSNHFIVPSDAVNGNFLEAINTSLNILDKHYMDRALQRTGNSIVMISAGAGVFKVKPNLAQITKQRMVDQGIGLDFISLSKPAVHAVPLFLVDCKSENLKNFYEFPHWIRVSYIDCEKEIRYYVTTHTSISHNKAVRYSELGLDIRDTSKSSSWDSKFSKDESPDSIWAKTFQPQPTSFLLTSQLMNAGDLQSLAIGYTSVLPSSLKLLLNRHDTHEKIINSMLLQIHLVDKKDSEAQPAWFTSMVGSMAKTFGTILENSNRNDGIPLPVSLFADGQTRYHYLCDMSYLDIIIILCQLVRDYAVTDTLGSLATQILSFVAKEKKPYNPVNLNKFRITEAKIPRPVPAHSYSYRSRTRSRSSSNPLPSNRPSRASSSAIPLPSIEQSKELESYVVNSFTYESDTNLTSTKSSVSLQHPEKLIDEKSNAGLDAYGALVISPTSPHLSPGSSIGNINEAVINSPLQKLNLAKIPPQTAVDGHTILSLADVNDRLEPNFNLLRGEKIPTWGLNTRSNQLDMTNKKDEDVTVRKLSNPKPYTSESNYQNDPSNFILTDIDQRTMFINQLPIIVHDKTNDGLANSLISVGSYLNNFMPETILDTPTPVEPKSSNKSDEPIVNTVGGSRSSDIEMITPKNSIPTISEHEQYDNTKPMTHMTGSYFNSMQPNNPYPGSPVHTHHFSGSFDSHHSIHLIKELMSLKTNAQKGQSVSAPNKVNQVEEVTTSKDKYTPDQTSQNSDRMKLTAHFNLDALERKSQLFKISNLFRPVLKREEAILTDSIQPVLNETPGRQSTGDSEEMDRNRLIEMMDNHDVNIFRRVPPQQNTECMTKGVTFEKKSSNQDLNHSVLKTTEQIRNPKEKFEEKKIEVIAPLAVEQGKVSKKAAGTAVSNTDHVLLDAKKSIPTSNTSSALIVNPSAPQSTNTTSESDNSLPYTWLGNLSKLIFGEVPVVVTAPIDDKNLESKVETVPEPKVEQKAMAEKQTKPISPYTPTFNKQREAYLKATKFRGYDGYPGQSTTRGGGSKMTKSVALSQQIQSTSRDEQINKFSPISTPKAPVENKESVRNKISSVVDMQEEHDSNPSVGDINEKTQVLQASESLKSVPTAKKPTSKNEYATNRLKSLTNRSMLAAGIAVPTNERDNKKVILHDGKIMQVNESQQREAERMAFAIEYCSRNSINPFKQKDGDNYLKSVTHNRRRWSHVFPPANKSKADYGLNWKSLTQPAILPLSTDYIPNVHELKNNYEVQANYELVLDRDSVYFVSPEDLLQELVCQRLIQEFQLVEGSHEIDIDAYATFLNSNSEITATLTRQSFTPNILARRPAKLSSWENQLQNIKDANRFYILSLGHRIQFLQYNKSEDKVVVKAYRSTKGQKSESDKSFIYQYELWMPQVKRFETITQTFYQFPQPEFLWNKLDNIINKNIPFDDTAEDIKSKRLKYSIIPEVITNKKEMDEYFSKIDQLLDFVSKFIGEKKECTTTSAPLVIEKNRLQYMQTGSSSSSMKSTGINQSDILTNRSAANYLKQTIKQVNFVEKPMRGSPKHVNPNWLYIKYDHHLYSFKVFHIEFHWLVCDSWLLDEFITVFLRRCKQFGLRAVQVPEYFTSSNLIFHPFRSQPYIPVPTLEGIQIPPQFPSPIRLIERLYFDVKNGEWIFDSELQTDWKALGLSVPDYFIRDRDLQFDNILNTTSNTEGVVDIGSQSISNVTGGGGKSPLSALSKWLLSSKSPSTSSNLSNDDNLDANLPIQKYSGMSRKVVHKLDRQYIHSMGFAAVRVAGQGFIWLLNSSAKVTNSGEEKVPTTLSQTTSMDSRPDRRSSIANNFSSSNLFGSNHVTSPPTNSSPIHLSNYVFSPTQQMINNPGGKEGSGTVAVPTEDRETMINRKIQNLQEFCVAVVECYEIIIDITEKVFVQIAIRLEMSVNQPAVSEISDIDGFPVEGMIRTKSFASNPELNKLSLEGSSKFNLADITEMSIKDPILFNG